MSKYTTEVRYVCEHYAGFDASQEYPAVAEVISKSRTKIFDFDYPIFDTDYKSVLETKILRHYYTREIGEETVALWKLRLEMRLNDIMPYYNKLYESELLKFNPLYDVDMTSDHTKDNTGDSSTVVDGTSRNTGTIGDVGDRDRTSVTTHNESEDHWDAYSDTPQGSLRDVGDMDYLTNARHNTDTMTGTLADTTEHIDTTNTRTLNTQNKNDVDTTNNFTTNEEYLEHIKGLNGRRSYSALLLEYRKTFLNIDLMVIEELADLFLNLW